MGESEGRSLPETPTWAVATVVAILVGVGVFFHGCLKRFGKWLSKTKRKHLLAALEKIKDELMLFGLLSLLLGHWMVFVTKICVKSSGLSSGFYLCAPEIKRPSFVNHNVIFRMKSQNTSFSSALDNDEQESFCPKGSQSFASHESLEQLHRLLFVLGMTHVLYSFYAIALAVVQIYSWRKWENDAKSLALQASHSSESKEASRRMTRLSTFVSYHTSHPWSNHRVLVWLLCFSRQFWSSINQADYKALRIGFITTHQLPLTYDFHRYMLRSMEEEFRDIVGISIPLWIFTILCVLLGVHGTNVYFWISFSPAVLVLLMGTKLHVIVVKLAVEITDATSQTEIHPFNLRDELFWFGKPRLLLRLIQFITFQNAFEMTLYFWSLWEIKRPSCFTENFTCLVIRLTFGLVSQFWCSFITFPLYIIVAQMGSKYKKTIVSGNVRRSIHEWKRKVMSRREMTWLTRTNTTSSMSLNSLVDENNDDDNGLCINIRSNEGFSGTGESPSVQKFQHNEISPCDQEYEYSAGLEYDANCDMYDMERYRNDQSNQDVKESSSLLQ